MVDVVYNKRIEWEAHPIIVAKYPKDDPIGMFFGYYSLLVYEIQAIYITLFLRNRDLVTFYCCFTHMLSEIMCYILKHMIKEPRPDYGAPTGGLFEGRYGMPSQHCHCFAYLITVILLLTFHYYRSHINVTKKVLTLVITIVGLLLQIMGRIYLGFHTLEQCLGGMAFGVLSASIFYTIGIYLFLPYADDMCRVWLLKMFHFRRDLVSHHPEKAVGRNIKTIKRK